MSQQFDLFALFDAPAHVVGVEPEIAEAAETLPPEPEAPLEDRPEQGPYTLRELLTTSYSAPATWESFAQHGATDEEILSEINCYYNADHGSWPKGRYAELVPEVRALFEIPAQNVNVEKLTTLELIQIAQDEAHSWTASGRSPLHCRANDELDKRGEKGIKDAGWPTHDGAVYSNVHTSGLTSYLEEITQYINPQYPNGHTRDTNVRYLVEHYRPCADPAALLPKAEERLAAARAIKPPKKSKPGWEPYELTIARKEVKLLKAEINSRTQGEQNDHHRTTEDRSPSQAVRGRLWPSD